MYYVAYRMICLGRDPRIRTLITEASRLHLVTRSPGTSRMTSSAYWHPFEQTGAYRSMDGSGCRASGLNGRVVVRGSTTGRWTVTGAHATQSLVVLPVETISAPYAPPGAGDVSPGAEAPSREASGQ